MWFYLIESVEKILVNSIYFIGIIIINLLIYLSSFKEINDIPKDTTFDYIIGKKLHLNLEE